MADHREQDSKEKDIKQIIRYLTVSFGQAMAKHERAAWTDQGPNSTYRLEQDFMYYIDDITRGPRCMMQKSISDCNDFIRAIG